MSNATDENTKEKEIEISNFNIKVHIPCLSVLLNSSILNSTKQKLTLSPVPSMLDLAKHNSESFSNQTDQEEDQYLASSFLVISLPPMSKVTTKIITLLL